ncbi:MAG: hypothetical protein Q9162_000238 [Coniocarpon cinnabarinum]
MEPESLSEILSYDDFVSHYGRDQCPMTREEYLFLARQLQVVPGNPGVFRYTGGHPILRARLAGAAQPEGLPAGAPSEPVGQQSTTRLSDRPSSAVPVDEETRNRKQTDFGNTPGSSAHQAAGATGEQSSVGESTRLEDGVPRSHTQERDQTQSLTSGTKLQGRMREQDQEEEQLDLSTGPGTVGHESWHDC